MGNPHEPLPNVRALHDPTGKKDGGGRTWPDLVSEFFNKPRMWLPLLGFCLLVAISAIVVAFEVPRLVSAETSELSIGGADTHIVIKSVGKHGNGTYIVVVSPQGWQPTEIPVRKGDHIAISAGGKVCIDVGSILAMVKKRSQYEEEWATKKKIRRNDATETRVPEDYFTESEQRDLILERPWVDPNGFSLDQFHPSFRSRRQRYLLPNSPAGGLVAAVGGPNSEPKQQSAFFVGRENKDIAVLTDGSLWFTVNDVQYQDVLNRYLFYNDNIGYFWVRIEVRHP
jgi:hypothetical protein